MTEQEFEVIYNSLVRLMFKVLCKFHLRDDEEAVSEARLALYKAIKTYNKDRKVKLSNYAYECIQNKMLAYIRVRKKDIPWFKLVEYEGIRDRGDDYEQFEESSTINYKEHVEAGLFVEEFRASLSEREKIIVDELLIGTKKGDIPKKVGVSREWVRKLLNGIRYKYIEYTKFNNSDD